MRSKCQKIISAEFECAEFECAEFECAELVIAHGYKHKDSSLWAEDHQYSTRTTEYNAKS